MTTTRNTSSHANCTHEKTKAGRAACRKSGTVLPPAQSAKAKPASDAPHVDLYETMAEPAVKAEAVSGFCGNGTHDRCPGAGKQWACSCDCH